MYKRQVCVLSALLSSDVSVDGFSTATRPFIASCTLVTAEMCIRDSDYHHHKLFFISSGSQLPYTVSKNKKIQWLTNDICAFTYMSPDDSQIHQYIATYGDRTLGSYYYVTNVIGGDWTTYDTNNTVGWHILVDDGVMLKYGETKEYYSLDDCVQFGTTAIALCKNGIPQWTIVLNEDCEVTSGSDLTDVYKRQS